MKLRIAGLSAILLTALSLFSCAGKPSKEAQEQARQNRLQTIRGAMTQTDSQFSAALKRLHEAKMMRKGPDRDAEIAAAKREAETYMHQKAALRVEMEKVMSEKREEP